MINKSEIRKKTENKFAENIIATVREPLVILDRDLRVVSANRSFYRTFKVTPKETEQQLLYNLGNGQWNIPKLRKLLEEILPQKTTVEDYEVEHYFETIGQKTMLLNARKIIEEEEELTLLAIEDISERRKYEELSLLSQKLESLTSRHSPTFT
jgi:two-component system CheB/CheR fusion protein